MCELSFWQYVNLESLCPLFRLQKANLQYVNLESLHPLFRLQKANLDVLEVIFSILQIFFREIHALESEDIGPEQQRMPVRFIKCRSTRTGNSCGNLKKCKSQVWRWGIQPSLHPFTKQMSIEQLVDSKVLSPLGADDSGLGEN